MSKVFIDRENKEKVHKNKIIDEKYVRLPDNYINIINPVRTQVKVLGCVEFEKLFRSMIFFSITFSIP